MDNNYENICVSVVVAIYKVEKYLDKCIQSIINQTHKNLEIILVDDGSPDNCPEICNKYANLDNRIVLIHKNNGGVVNARYDGIKIASGKYTMVFDGDDWLDSDYIKLMLREAESSLADLVISNYIEDFEITNYICHMKIPNGVYENHHLNQLKQESIYTEQYYEFGINPALWNKLFLTEKLKKFLLCDENRVLVIGEDFAITLPYIMDSNRVSIISSFCSYHYMQRSGSALRSYQPTIIENIKKIKSYFESFEWHRKYSYQLNHYYSWLIIYAFRNQLKESSNLFVQNKSIKEIYDIPDLDLILDDLDYNKIPFAYKFIFKNLKHKNILFLQITYGLIFNLKNILKIILKK